MKKYTFLFLSLFFVLVACREGNQNRTEPSSNRYAGGFAISEEDGITVLTIKNPWEKARDVEVKYYLVGRDMEVPSSLSGKNIIRTPLKSVICLSTTHLGFLDKIGEIGSVSGISGGIYVTNPEVLRRLQNGEIPDVGYGQNLNYEEIIRLKPDVVMVYGVDSDVTGILGKFRDLGIATVLNAEYLENSPLGKAEWIKFAGALFDKQEWADSVFISIENEYNRLKDLVPSGNSRPGVMMGLPYRDAWWVPGGKSYMANLIGDAGGNYLGLDNSSRESYVISFEQALVWASQAEVWLNVGMVNSRQEIIAADSRFARFGVFNNGKIYNNNKRTTMSGGADFWESGVAAPEKILSDLISIFHPGLMPGHTLFYYQEIR
jgi:iron complex transport system substrate-binding protein